MIKYDRQDVGRFAAELKAKGYRVFIADRGTYGFFTDEDGSRVVSFSSSGGQERVGGNYITNQPRQTGTGWVIAGDWAFDVDKIDDYFKAEPPHWAIGTATYRLTTLKEHLKTYQSSSKFTEI